MIVGNEVDKNVRNLLKEVTADWNEEDEYFKIVISMKSLLSSNLYELFYTKNIDFGFSSKPICNLRVEPDSNFVYYSNHPSKYTRYFDMDKLKKRLIMDISEFIEKNHMRLYNEINCN